MSLADRAFVVLAVLIAYIVVFSGLWLCAYVMLRLEDRFGWDLGSWTGVLAWAGVLVWLVVLVVLAAAVIAP